MLSLISLITTGGGERARQTGRLVLESASHYWPLERVDGLNELCRNNADVVQGVVSRGIYLEGSPGTTDISGNTGITLLHFGSSTNSCITEPERCGNAGVTFSFFWRSGADDPDGSVPQALGSKLLSTRFSVYAGGSSGFVLFHAGPDARSWRARVHPPGRHWTHILFTWQPLGGLKVYVNGSLSSTDPLGSRDLDTGSASLEPGSMTRSPAGSTPPGSTPPGSTPELTPSGHHVTGSFDEFVIWERALTPQEIQMYYSTTTGVPSCDVPSVPEVTLGPGPSATQPPASADPVAVGVGAGTGEGDQRFRYTGGGGSVAAPFIFPNDTLQSPAAHNLTRDFLQTVGEILAVPSWSGSAELASVLGELLDTVDGVMGRVAALVDGQHNRVVTVNGSSTLADYSLVKLPAGSRLPTYRFPSHGHSYILIPGNALNTHRPGVMVGMLYHTLHTLYGHIRPLDTRINGATLHKDHLITVGSRIISLKIDPPPTLSHNLSGSPLITITLSHILTPAQSGHDLNSSTNVWCSFLNFSSGRGVWSNEGCARIGGNISHSVCRCNHLTNFAILMQVVPLELERVHVVALSAITYVGCSLSIVCLTVTLVTLAVLSSVSSMCNQRYHIHANLSVSILAAHILLLLSFRFSPDTLPCKVSAILLHFLFLSTFSWMLVEGLHLYNMVVRVFGSEDSKHVYYYSIGWGSPLVICVMSVTSTFHSYGTADKQRAGLLIGRLALTVDSSPLRLQVNVGILIAVTRIISRISMDNYKVHRDTNASKLTVKAVAVLLPILGISWACGVLAINNYALFFQYMFAFFNSLQGFFIFLFHCVLNSEVRAALKHKTKVWSLNSSSMRNINVKPFNSEIMNGNRGVSGPTKINTWDRSTEMGHRADMSAV
ncbi:LOW QUALITY PROTEIN: adhesion G-protein coupled receptor D1 [Leucoraja erinacea]|uniref:LOW QUALITY PROTEIN: adhesion G-protein coupled receptor D1 n=1 Tax=Leucoraja erinaceus TaxID=7782 RepID=UPI002456A3C5|nr:LOW QUALITY PROTEIN: adhesion G-protein coupled receptor D1 [Leucoraja erinacea]